MKKTNRDAAKKSRDQKKTYLDLLENISKVKFDEVGTLCVEIAGIRGTEKVGKNVLLKKICRSSR